MASAVSTPCIPQSHECPCAACQRGEFEKHQRPDGKKKKKKNRSARHRQPVAAAGSPESASPSPPQGYYARCFVCEETAVHLWDAPLPSPAPRTFWAWCPGCEERTPHEWTVWGAKHGAPQIAPKGAAKEGTRVEDVGKLLENMLRLE